MRSQASDSEWRLHDDTSRALGFAEKQAPFVQNGTAVMVANNKKPLTPWAEKLGELLPIKTVIAAVEEALDHVDNPKSEIAPMCLSWLWIGQNRRKSFIFWPP